MEQSHTIDAFFTPRSIAVIGASGDLSKMASRPLAYLRRHGYRGGIHPVNPKYAELGGYPCVPDIDALPEGIDLALISLPAESIPETVRRCARRGVRLVTILSGGFSEVGTDQGRRLDQALRDVVRETGIRVCGPNCQGGINLFDRVVATYSGALAGDQLSDGPIGLITQSGVFGGLVFAAAQEEGIGVGYWTSTGNELDLKFSDFLDYVVAQDRIRVIGGYLESVKDEGSRFVEALRNARRAGKPVVLLKTGRTEAGRAAAASHTAALAGDDDGYSAAFMKGGAVRVDSSDEFRELVAAFSTGRIPKGRRVGILSISGGAATLMADECSQRGLTLVRFSEGLKQRLGQVVPAFGSVVNPVDLTGQLVADASLLEKSAVEVLRSGEVDALAIFIGMCDGNKDELVEVIGRLAAQTDLAIAVTWVAAADSSVYPRIRSLGVPVFKDATACIGAMARMTEWQLASVRSSSSRPESGFHQEFLQLLSKRRAGSLTEVEVKTLLAAVGLPVPHGKLLKDRAQARAAVQELGGDSVMKLQARSVQHKSDIGGVRVGVTTEQAEQEFLSLQKLFPADAEGVLVEARIRDGVECFVGTKLHPIFGPMIAVGLGGVFIEVFKDVALRLAPVSHEEALEMIGGLKGLPLLKGARGGVQRDVDALADLVHRVSMIAAAADEAIREMDLNPVFVRAAGEGVVIGDALLTTA